MSPIGTSDQPWPGSAGCKAVTSREHLFDRLSQRCASEPASARGKLRRRIPADLGQRQHAVAREVGDRVAGDGLVAGAGGWGAPDPALLLKSAAVYAGDQGGPFRGRQMDDRRAWLIGGEQYCRHGTDQLSAGSRFSSVVSEHGQVPTVAEGPKARSAKSLCNNATGD